MKKIFQHIPRIIVMIINWIVIQHFSFNVPMMNFMLLFIATALEYCLIFCICKILSACGIKISTNRLTYDLILQTTLFCFLGIMLVLLPINSLPQSIAHSVLIFSCTTALFYGLAEHYNRALKKNEKFKSTVDLIYWIGVGLLPFMVLAAAIIDHLYTNVSFRIFFLSTLPLIVIKGVPYAYTYVEKENT